MKNLMGFPPNYFHVTQVNQCRGCRPPAPCPPCCPLLSHLTDRRSPPSKPPSSGRLGEKWAAVVERNVSLHNGCINCPELDSEAEAKLILKAWPKHYTLTPSPHYRPACGANFFLKVAERVKNCPKKWEIPSKKSYFCIWLSSNVQ